MRTKARPLSEERFVRRFLIDHCCEHLADAFPRRAVLMLRDVRLEIAAEEFSSL